MKYLFSVIFISVLSCTAAFGQTTGHTTFEKQQVYRYVDQMPDPGYDVNEYMAKNMRYPEEAKKAGEKGRVFVDFVIQADGKATNITVRNSFRYPIIAKEATRLVETMPAWKPGKKDGKAVNVASTLTIIFNP